MPRQWFLAILGGPAAPGSQNTYRKHCLGNSFQPSWAARQLPGAKIGVKRNAERYMFQEPRPPVDAVWARIRDPPFSFRQVQSDVNFAVTFAKSALLGPKMHVGYIFRILSPKSILELKMHFFAQNRFWAKRGSIFIKVPLVLSASAAWGRKSAFLRKKCTFAPKMHFCAQNAFLEQKSDFGSKNRFFGLHGGQEAKKKLTCM